MDIQNSQGIASQHSDFMSQPPAKKVRKSRDPNYNSIEEVAMIDVIDKYQKIITAKHDNNVTNLKKNKAWDEVARAVSAVSVHSRDASSVRKHWSLMKRMAKKRNSDIWNHIRGTGGGPPCPEQKQPLDDRVLTIMGETCVYGLKEGLDSMGGPELDKEVEENVQFEDEALGGMENEDADETELYNVVELVMHPNGAMDSSFTVDDLTQSSQISEDLCSLARGKSSTPRRTIQRKASTEDMFTDGIALTPEPATGAQPSPSPPTPPPRSFSSTIVNRTKSAAVSNNIGGNQLKAPAATLRRQGLQLPPPPPPLDKPIEFLPPSSVKRRGSIQGSILEIETKLLAVQEKRLAVEEKRLKLEERRMEMAEERHAREKRRFEELTRRMERGEYEEETSSSQRDSGFTY